MNIVIDTSNFRPFDYQPYFLVMEAYNKRYDAEQAMYDSISLKLGDLRTAVEGTEKAKGIYDKYMEGLNKATDRFAKGRNVNTAKELSQLRKMYGTDIRLLELARDLMLNNTKSLQLARLKDPTLFSLDLGNLDTYLSNPNYTPLSYSGNMLMADVSNMAKTLAAASALLEKGEKLDKFTNTFSKRYGLRPEEVEQAIEQLRTTGTISNLTLWNMVDSAVTSSGMKNWANENQLLYAYEWAGKGLYQGIGKEDIGTYEDPEAKALLDLWVAKQKADYEILKQAAILALKNQPQVPGNGEINTHTSFIEASGDLSKYNDLYNTIIIKDAQGNNRLNEEYIGKNAINPLVVYEEAQAAYEAGLRVPLTDNLKNAQRGTRAYQASLGAPTSNDYNYDEANRARKAVLDKYGVKKILSPAEYKALQELGYTSRSSLAELKYNIADRINNFATENSYSSVNLTNLKLTNKAIKTNLSNRQSNSSFENTLWEMEINGNIGKSVSNTKDITGMSLNDISYSIKQPDKLILTFADNDYDNAKTYYADPSIINTEVRNLIRPVAEVINSGNELAIRQYAARLAMTIAALQGLLILVNPNSFTTSLAKTYIQETVTGMLRDLARALNKQITETDSKIE